MFFEEPFWVGLYQRWSGPKLEVAKITFGAEPKDGEVYQFLLEHWKRLSFSPPVEQEIPEERRVNPKRARREIQRKELSARPGTKSQQALALQRETAKASRQEDARQRKEREREEKFQIRQRKRKEKHRGR